MKIIKLAVSCLLIIISVAVAGCSPRNYEQVTVTESTTETVVKTNREFTLELPSVKAVNSRALSVYFVADKRDKYFYKINGKSMDRFFMSGVNIGLSDATTDLGNPDVGYSTYMEWFTQISQMNANTIRVFTEMPPQFYEAFYDYNTKNKNKLYLVHGIWFNEGFMEKPGDCWDKERLVISSFKRAVNEILDIVHGNCKGITYGTNTNAVYNKDISKWVAGYILGLEWSNDFITNSNSHKGIKGYSGKYLTTNKNVTPFESFLAEVGDTLIKRDTEKYKTQTPVAFLNWFTNDTLTHSNEAYREEDSVSVNTENISATKNYIAGCYGALDIYPYYPSSMNYQQDYRDYKDDLTGKQNNYKAYLQDLKKEYSVPVIIAEFGLPTSKGMAAESVLGYNQGNITEQQQGEYVSNMLVDIASSGYSGGLIFSWQDEWFKRTWNTYAFAPDEPAKRTPNRMSAEQNYGILAMEPGINSICTVNGVDFEWEKDKIISKTENVELRAKFDEGYFYLCIRSKNGKIENKKIAVPVSIKGYGSDHYKRAGISFSRNADFVIMIDGRDNTKLLTDSYWDYFEFRYGFQEGAVKTSKAYGKKNSGAYNIARQFVSGEQYLPETKKTIPVKINECGKLVFGTTDTESSEYNCLADFCFKDDILEMRIPWSMLNVLNITEGKCFNCFEKEKSADTTDISEIYIGADYPDKGKKIKLSPIKYRKRSASYFHTRLKKSYDYIKNTNKMLLKNSK